MRILLLWKEPLPKKIIERTRGGGRYTEAEFWSFIRSALRQKSRRWAPIYQCMNDARRASKDKSNPKLKWQYKCAKCRKWKPAKEVSVDHIVPAGSLRREEDLARFVSMLFCEQDNLQVLCKPCHDKKTKEDTKR